MSVSQPAKGIVYLVGAGPGDPGLLTLRGLEVLRLAEVVIYDHLANPRLLAYAPETALRVEAGKSVGHCTLNQAQINQALLDHAQQGLRVVRLKGGDPFVFGRGGEEADYLRQHGCRYEVIPGVTAAIGASAYAGIPVTHRDDASSLCLVTGHDDPLRSSRIDWRLLAHFSGTLVVYMGVTRLSGICAKLIHEGKSDQTPACMIQWGTLPAQRTVVGTLATLPSLVAEAGIGPPALLVVGDVVSRRQELAWFEHRPLFGQRIVVTRPLEESVRSASQLEAMGAEVVSAPMVQILPVEDTVEVDAAILGLARFDWLVFTSSNGVRAFFQRLWQLGKDLRVVGHLKFAAIGPTTAEALEKWQIRADLVPDAFRSEELAEALAVAASRQRILLARADRGRTLLKDRLSQVAEVEQVAVYRNVDADASTLPTGLMQRLEEGSVDWVTLTSSAIAERFLGLLTDRAREQVGGRVKLASLSPVTTSAIERLGFFPTVEARRYDWDGLIDAIEQHVIENKSKSSHG